MIFDHAKEHDKFLEAESSVEQMMANRNDCDRQGLSTPSQQTDLGRFASTSSNNYLMNLPVDSSFLFDSEEDEDEIMSNAENARRSELEIITRDIFDYDVLESEVNVDSILDGKQKEAKHLIEHELSMNGEDANIATNKDHKAESCDLDSSPSHGDKRISENKHFSGLSGDDHSGKHFLATPRTPDPDENHSSSPIPWSPIPPSFQETFEKQNAVLRNQTNQPLWKDDDFAVDTDVLEYLTVPSLDKHADDGTKKALKRLTTQTASHEETENKIYTGSKTGTMIKHVAPPSRQNCEVGNSSKEHSEEGESCEGGSWGDSSNRMEEEEKYKSLRPRQSGQWFYMFDQLRAFQKNHGHCSVPYGFSPNEQLARWVKRQRYQYKLLKKSKEDGTMATSANSQHKASTLSKKRVQMLQDIGFVFDYQDNVWDEKISELRAYSKKHKNCNVPANHAENPRLAIWVKCQRRQYKLYMQQKPSSMTADRIRELERLGFQWGLRNQYKTASQIFAAAAATASTNGTPAAFVDASDSSDDPDVSKTSFSSNKAGADKNPKGHINSASSTKEKGPAGKATFEESISGRDERKSCEATCCGSYDKSSNESGKSGKYSPNPSLCGNMSNIVKNKKLPLLAVKDIEASSTATTTKSEKQITEQGTFLAESSERRATTNADLDENFHRKTVEAQSPLAENSNNGSEAQLVKETDKKVFKGKSEEKNRKKRRHLAEVLEKDAQGMGVDEEEANVASNSKKVDVEKRNDLSADGQQEASSTASDDNEVE